LLTYQIPLPLPRSGRARLRSVRGPFRPSQGTGPYRLPRDVSERLAASLSAFRNRDAAFTLATFLGRFWSVPGRIVDAFPVDRRAIADHPELGLTEAQVRGALRTLEAVGFLDRAVTSGSRYRATEDGLRRKVILFMFGSEYAPAFIAANRRAAAAKGGRPGDRRPIPARSRQSASTAFSAASPLRSPKSKSVADKPVLMGEIKTGNKESGILPRTSEPNTRLEAALDRLRRGVFGEAEEPGGNR